MYLSSFLELAMENTQSVKYNRPVPLPRYSSIHPQASEERPEPCTFIESPLCFKSLMKIGVNQCCSHVVKSVLSFHESRAGFVPLDYGKVTHEGYPIIGSVWDVISTHNLWTERVFTTYREYQK